MDWVWTFCLTCAKLNELEVEDLILDTPILPWSLESIFGDDVPDNSDFLGQPLLILFFGLSCPGCLGRAVPYANRTVVELGDRISVIGIHSDFHRSGFTDSQFQKAKEALYIRFPFYRDQNFDRTFKDYRAGGTPHWILLDAEGKVKYSLFGSDPNNALLKLDYRIAELLAS